MVKRYRCSDLITFAAGNEAVLVYNRTNRSAALLSPSDLDVLNRCNTFRPLEEHAQTLASELNSDPLVAELSTNTRSAPVGRFLKRLRDFAQQQGVSFDNHSKTELLILKLQEFANAGLLISETDLLPNRELPPETEERIAIATIGVVTRNRPDFLIRCVTSYIESCNRHGRDVDFVVVDDSEEGSVREETRRSLRLLQGEYGTRIFYAGLEEKKSFAERLIAAGDLPAEVVNFALFDVERCGYTVGANRNALLLHTTGDMLFSADDDTVCSLARSPQAAFDQLAFFSGIDPTSFWFFPDRQATIEAVTVEDKDILSLHERLLGKGLDRCIKSSSDVAFDQADARFLRELQSNSARVRTTMTGVYGDSGMWSPSWQLRLSGDSYARLTESKATYDSAFTSREILRTVNCLTIAGGDFCMAYALGLDNRTLLPPFFPVHRNEDGLFASTLRICFEHAYIAHLPWAVMHVPEARKYSAADTWEKPFVHSIDNVVLACFASFNYPPGMMRDTERLRTVGQHLMNLGSSSLNAFEEFIRIYLWHLRSANITALEEELASNKDAPDFWSHDVAKQIELLRQSLLEEVYQPPKDLLDGRSNDEARRLTQRLILKFGELLYWWPQIVVTAKSLRADGVRLGVAL
jgi:hypothetical protein